MRLFWTAVGGSGAMPAAVIRMLPGLPSVSTSFTQLEPMSRARNEPPRGLGRRSLSDRWNNPDNPANLPPSPLGIPAHLNRHDDDPLSWLPSHHSGEVRTAPCSSDLSRAERRGCECSSKAGAGCVPRKSQPKCVTRHYRHPPPTKSCTYPCGADENLTLGRLADDGGANRREAAFLVELELDRDPDPNLGKRDRCMPEILDHRVLGNLVRAARDRDAALRNGRHRAHHLGPGNAAEQDQGCGDRRELTAHARCLHDRPHYRHGTPVEHSRHESGVTLLGSSGNGSLSTLPLEATNPREPARWIVTVSSVGMLFPISRKRMS